MYQPIRQSELVEGQLSNAEDLILRVIIVTVGIAMGFMLAQSIGEIFFKMRRKRKNKRNLV